MCCQIKLELRLLCAGKGTSTRATFLVSVSLQQCQHWFGKPCRCMQCPMADPQRDTHTTQEYNHMSSVYKHHGGSSVLSFFKLGLRRLHI